MILDLLMIAIGLATLVVGADGLVRGASAIATRLGVPALVIGLTVVAFGTSMPELVVNLIAAWSGSPGLAIGNILGSNIANIFLILGVAALVAPLSVQRSTVWKEIPFALLGATLLLVVGSDALLDQGVDIISRTDGISLLSIMAIFMIYLLSIAQNSPEETIEEVQVEVSTTSSVLWVLAGLAGLVIGGQLLVDGAIRIALGLGLTESVVGLTIVAFGTSLPELATTVVAVIRKQTDIAIGNIIGSNIFNIFFVLGLTATALPLPLPDNFTRDVLVVITATILLFVFMFIGRKQQLRRWEGVAFLALYVAYMSAVLVQG